MEVDYCRSVSVFTISDETMYPELSSPLPEFKLRWVILCIPEVQANFQLEIESVIWFPVRYTNTTLKGDVDYRQILSVSLLEKNG